MKMKRRNFTKGLFAFAALIALPVTYAIKEVKKRFVVKTYTVKIDYDFKNQKLSKLEWIHKDTKEIEM